MRDDGFMGNAIVSAVLLAALVWWAIHGRHIPTVYDIPRLEKRIQQLEADRAR